MKLLMLAPPGGGKGTQGARIAEHLGIEHVSSGDLLRDEVAKDTPLGREVADHMAHGRLAPDDLVTQAVTSALAARKSYILDGFPRTLSQAEGFDFDAVIYLDVADAALTKRLLARGRADDKPAVIEERLRAYAEDTRPLVDHYRDRGRLLEIDGDRPPDEITADIVERLKA